MKSLSYLNTIGQTSITVTDSRYAKAIFDRVAPLLPEDQIFEITTTSPTIHPGINIIEIINYSTANVRYRVKIDAAGSPLLTGSTITFPTLPTGVTKTVVGNTYTLSGINSVSAWDAIKTFTWNLPSNYDSCLRWNLEISIIYYDEESGQDITVDWLAYDPDHYFFAELSSSFTMATIGNKCKLANAADSSTASLAAIVKRLPGAIAALTSTTSLSATGVKNPNMVDAIARCTLTANARKARLLTASITSNATVYAKPYFLAQLTSTATLTATLSPAPFLGTVTGYTTTLNVDYTGDLSIVWSDGTTITNPTKNSSLVHTWSGTTSTNFTITGTLTSLTITAPSLHIYRFNPELQSLTITSSTYVMVPPALNSAMRYVSFLNCPKLCVEAFGTSTISGISDSDYHFYYNTAIPSWNTSKLTSMDRMFYNCPYVNASFNSWDVSNVTNMNEMFYGCLSLDGTGDASGDGYEGAYGSFALWDVSNVTNMDRMFYGCTVLNADLSTWDISNVTSHTDFDLNTSSWLQSHPFNEYSASGSPFIVSLNNFRDFTQRGKNMSMFMTPSVWINTLSYAVGDYVNYYNAVYKCITAHTSSTWNSSKWQLQSYAWSSGVSYPVGSYVIYDGYIYKCIIAHSTSYGGSFDPSKWQISVSTIVDSGAISGQQYRIVITTENSTYINGDSHGLDYTGTKAQINYQLEVAIYGPGYSTSNSTYTIVVYAVGNYRPVQVATETHNIFYLAP